MNRIGALDVAVNATLRCTAPPAWLAAISVSLEEAQSHEALYGEANAVVSTSHWEPFGRTVIEGYARALPVVAFASGALPELIEDGVTGRLVPDGDVDAMATVVAEVAGDPVPISPDEDEMLEVDYLTSEEIEDGIRAGDITDAKSVAIWALYKLRAKSI